MVKNPHQTLNLNIGTRRLWPSFHETITIRKASPAVRGPAAASAPRTCPAGETASAECSASRQFRKAVTTEGGPISAGPKDHINIRISQSGFKAQ